MRPIGGFFELELPDGHHCYHEHAVALSTGRSCLTYLIEVLNPTRVYVPTYTCEAVFSPFLALNVDVVFYSINQQLEIKEQPELRSDEYIIYINYFGLKGDYIRSLQEVYGLNLIIDDTHAFFNKGYSEGNYSFTSARKFFGTPDGAFLYTSRTVNYELARFTNYSYDHGILRLNGEQEEAFQAFKINEQLLDNRIRLISPLSEKLLRLIDYESVIKIRTENFNRIHKELHSYNSLPITMSTSAPFCYPFLPAKWIDKSNFYKNQLFIPTLWPDVLDRVPTNSFEFDFTKRILPLPVDQRYGQKEMTRLVELVLDFLN